MIDNLFHLKSQQDPTPLHKFQRFSILGKLWNGNFLSMSPFPCHFVSQPPPALPIISCLCFPIPSQTFCAFAFPAIILFPSPLPFILCPSPSPQSCVSPPPLPSCFVFFDLSQIILSPLPPSPYIAIHWISTTKTSWVIQFQWRVLSKLWTTGALRSQI